MIAKPKYDSRINLKELITIVDVAKELLFQSRATICYYFLRRTSD